MQRIFCERASALLLLLLISGLVHAYPEMGAIERIEGLQVIPDREKNGIYYYLPQGIQLASRSDGGVDANLFVTRYTGTAVMGDQGARRLKSLFRARLEMQRPAPKLLSSVKRFLKRRDGRRVRVLPMPVTRLDASLVLVALEQEPQGLDQGALEPLESESASSFWRAREYSVRLDDATAQLMFSRWGAGDLLVSLEYSFWSDAWDRLQDDVTSNLPSDVVANTGDHSESTPQQLQVLAGALPIRVDAEKYPDRIQKIDINDTLPPGYPVLDVYCFDFRDEPDAPLFEKQLEVEASGVVGGHTRQQVAFSRDAAEVTKRRVRFPFAVDFSTPFRYRITEVLATGEEREGSWLEHGGWSGPLDISGSIQGEK
ncbi:MAG: hypothetical protein ABW148_01895 [Sedimenticola sp.]